MLRQRILGPEVEGAFNSGMVHSKAHALVIRGELHNQGSKHHDTALLLYVLVGPEMPTLLVQENIVQISPIICMPTAPGGQQASKVQHVIWDWSCHFVGINLLGLTNGSVHHCQSHWGPQKGRRNG